MMMMVMMFSFFRIFFLFLFWSLSFLLILCNLSFLLFLWNLSFLLFLCNLSLLLFLCNLSFLLLFMSFLNQLRLTLNLLNSSLFCLIHSLQLIRQPPFFHIIINLFPLMPLLIHFDKSLRMNIYSERYQLLIIIIN